MSEDDTFDIRSAFENELNRAIADPSIPAKDVTQAATSQVVLLINDRVDKSNDRIDKSNERVTALERELRELIEQMRVTNG